MAITKEQNDRLTQVGKGTPMGNLLRRYWQPIGTVPELEKEPVQRVRIFGEDLTLYRSRVGTYGLLGDRCPHRCVSFEYGIPQVNGLRCAYHGWLFDETGRCIEQPYEDTVNPAGAGRSHITTTAYPVQELGGLIFAYLGPDPAPLLPRWDLLVREDIDRVIDIHELPCNWLQCMDNAADPVHFEHLHAVFGNYQLEKMGLPPAMNPARHLRIEFDEFPYGIMKRRLLEGEPETEDNDDWTVGHPLLFPNILAVGQADLASLQFRVPIDDTNTLQFGYRTSLRVPDSEARPTVAKRTYPFKGDERYIADNVPKQDMLAWVAQSAVCDRTREHLGASDKGVILYHRMLMEQMDRVARGEEPMAVIRDAAENEPFIDIHRERVAMAVFDSKYENYFEKLEQLAVTAEK